MCYTVLENGGRKASEGEIAVRVDVLGVAFDNVTKKEAVDRAMALLEEDGPHLAATPNPEMVQRAGKDPEFAQVLSAAQLVIPDGIGIVWAARILKRPLKGRVPGIDFASALMEQMARTGKRLFLLGAAPAKDGQPSVAEQAAANLQRACPGLVICGTHDGYFKEDGPVVQQIRDARADVVPGLPPAGEVDRRPRRGDGGTAAHRPGRFPGRVRRTGEAGPGVVPEPRAGVVLPSGVTALPGRTDPQDRPLPAEGPGRAAPGRMTARPKSRQEVERNGLYSVGRRL